MTMFGMGVALVSGLTASSLIEEPKNTRSVAPSIFVEEAAPAPSKSVTIQLATWSASTTATGWVIKSGKNTTIKMPNERTARRTAKKFNKIERQAKKESGYKADADGPCGQSGEPGRSVLC